jgi:hypothetical protein
LSETIDTKACSWCAEPIRARAKVCICCGRLQPKSQAKIVWPSAIPFLVAAVFFVIGAVQFRNLFAPGREFEPFRERIAIVESQMHFSQTTNGNYISAMGQIRNDSTFAWKDFQLEVQYYDKEGRMIDTRSERLMQTIPAAATNAFRIRASADKPESAYASHKVFVRSAGDARRWL